MKQAFSSEKDLGEFTFFRIPKAIMSPIYKGVSIMSKFVYGLLMERLGLSIKNEWKDTRGTYIYFTVLELADEIGCSRNKTIKILAELENANLILRIKTGQGRPAKIYVLKPVEYKAANKKQTKALDKTADKSNEETETEHSCEPENVSADIEKYAQNEPYEPYKPENTSADIEKYAQNELYEPCEPENTSADIKEHVQNEHCEVENLNFLKLKNGTSRSLKTQLLEVDNLNPNNTEYNNTEWNNTEESNTDNNKKRETEFSAESINPSNILQKFNFENKDDGLDRWNLKYQQIIYNIKKQVDYDTLIGSNDTAVVDNIVNIMAEVMVLNKQYYEIGKERIPTALVRIRFGQITYQKLEAFLIDFGKICYRIKNPKAYLISALYNLPMTADAALANRINYDMANVDFDKAVKRSRDKCTQNRGGSRKNSDSYRERAAKCGGDQYARLMYM